MNQNNITGNVRRAMAKIMLDEVLQMIDSNKIKTITQKELIDYLEQFAANYPKDKMKEVVAMDAGGKGIQELFWDAGNILYADNSLLLRKPTDCDRGAFLQLQREYSFLHSLLKDEKYCSIIWKEHNDNDSLMLSITKDGEYIGYCGIKNLFKKPWEIVIELLPEWTHQGIGTAAVTAMLDALSERLSVAVFRVRIDSSNIASQGLFEKLGATPNGISKSILHKEEEIWQCEENNLHLIDDTLIAVAQKFDVEPRKLLSYVLEYTLCWKLKN